MSQGEDRDTYKRIDDELAESLSNTQKNRRAGTAFVSDIRGPSGRRRVTAENKHQQQRVTVEFELLYGDETFTRTFVRERYEQNHRGTPPLRKLFHQTDASYDDFHSVFDSSVPVKLDERGDWVLNFDVSNDAPKQRRIRTDEPTDSDTSTNHSVVGVVLMVVVTVVMAAIMGTIIVHMAQNPEPMVRAGVTFDTEGNRLETTLVSPGNADSLSVKYTVNPPNGEEYTTERTIDDTGDMATIEVSDGSSVEAVVVGQREDVRAVVAEYEYSF